MSRSASKRRPAAKRATSKAEGAASRPAKRTAFDGAGSTRGVWVVAEIQAGRVLPVSLEILGAGRGLADGLGTPLTALLLGAELEEAAQEAIWHGADTVLVAEHPRLASYRTAPHTAAAARLLLRERPAVVLLGATPNGRDLAGRLAVRVRAGLTADAVRLSLSQGRLAAYKSGFGGGILAAILAHTPVQMATVRPGVFPVPARDPQRRGRLRRVRVALRGEIDGARLLEEEQADEQEGPLKAERIVVVGRGAMGQLAPLRRLAGLLEAAVGATRPVCDAGLLPRSFQIGTTGLTVRPRLLVAVGVSGAMHFMSGAEESETLVAINVDPQAPILDQADFGLVGDAARVLPALLDALGEAVGARRSAA